jgi:hypothetical protein
MVDAGAVPSKDRATENKEPLSISLKHYLPNHECFSSWTPADLKKFSSTVRKLRGLTRMDLNKTNICSKLSNQNGWKLGKPKGVDRELDIFELRIAKGEDVRIFGVMISSVFYLIWLDRNHSVCA